MVQVGGRMMKRLRELTISAFGVAGLIAWHGMSSIVVPTATGNPTGERPGLRSLVLEPQDDGTVQLEVEIAGTLERLILQPHSVRSPGFRLRVQEEGGIVREIGAPESRTYRGCVTERGDCSVAVSIHDNAVTGTIILNGETWYVTPDDASPKAGQPPLHEVMTANQLPAIEGLCGNDDASELDESPPGQGGARSLDVKQVELAIDGDFEFFSRFPGSTLEEQVAATVAEIESIINLVSEIYELDAQVTFVLSDIILRTTAADPYTSTNPETLLNEFRAEWVANQTTVQRDTAHLLTGRDLDGIIVGLAHKPGMCSANAYALSMIRGTIGFSWYFWAAIISHEVGHNFNVSHCNEGISGGTYPCRIMCSSITSCNGSESFGPSARSTISARATGVHAACLSDGVVEPQTTALPFFDDFESSNIDRLRWVQLNDVSVPSSSGVNEPSGWRTLNLDREDSVRTRPMNLTRPATISYWTQHRSVEQDKTLQVEYYDSTMNRWRTLETITSDGVSQTQFTFHEHDSPADGLGENFALRFTPCCAPSVNSGDDWYIDDVRVCNLTLAVDFNGDCAENAVDYAFFVGCLAGPDQAIPAGCDATDFDASQSVDLRDFGWLQQLLGG